MVILEVIRLLETLNLQQRGVLEEPQANYAERFVIVQHRAVYRPSQAAWHLLKHYNGCSFSKHVRVKKDTHLKTFGLLCVCNSTLTQFRQCSNCTPSSSHVRVRKCRSH